MSLASRHLHCPFDATPLDPPPVGAAAKVGGRCSRCGYVDYLKPAPCVGFFIHEAGRVLLSRRGIEPAAGQWDIPGGFIDAGESTEDAVRREADEETTLVVEPVVCLGSLPDTYRSAGRDYPTLNFIYVARRVSGDPKPKDDVTELRWFDIVAIPELAFPHQVQAVELLRRYLDRPGG